MGAAATTHEISFDRPASAAADVTGPRRRRRDLLVGTAAGLIVTAAVVGYAVNGGRWFGDGPDSHRTLAFRVAVEPPEAVAALDGIPLAPGERPGVHLVELPADSDGLSWLDVSAPGYHTERRPLSPQSGATDIAIRLTPAPYEVFVSSEPAGAEVWFEGLLRGHTPMTLSVPAEQSGMGVLRRAGFEDSIFRVQPSTPGEPRVLELALTPACPTVLVESQPAGATILVDGVEHGTTPSIITLDTSYLGKNAVVQAVLRGHGSDATELAIPPVCAEPVEARFVLRQAAPSIAITTQPPGGHVVVDGVMLGRAPIEARFAPDQAGASVTVEAFVPGRRRGQRSVEIPANGAGSVPVTIQMDEPCRVVAFAIAADGASSEDLAVFNDRILDRIHDLDAAQEFVMVVDGDSGIETWPPERRLVRASGEQKIRAFDRVRSIQPYGTGDLPGLLTAVMDHRPDAIWLALARPPDSEALAAIDQVMASHPGVSVNLIGLSTSSASVTLTDWAAVHHGTHESIVRPTTVRLAGDAQEP